MTFQSFSFQLTPLRTHQNHSWKRLDSDNISNPQSLTLSVPPVKHDPRTAYSKLSACASSSTFTERNILLHLFEPTFHPTTFSPVESVRLAFDIFLTNIHAQSGAIDSPVFADPDPPVLFESCSCLSYAQ
ncbi:hypothetical protein Tco_0930317 [Tanacetum coccineum]